MLKPKKFQLKVQCDKWKKPLIIPIKKTEPFKILYIKCAEEMECDVQGFKLLYAYNYYNYKYVCHSIIYVFFAVLMANYWNQMIRPKIRIWKAMK